MDYKNTLNMPKSGFPMRAGLPLSLIHISEPTRP
mgnify:CR=1 FL=1